MSLLRDNTSCYTVISKVSKKAARALSKVKSIATSTITVREVFKTASRLTPPYTPTEAARIIATPLKPYVAIPFHRTWNRVKETIV